MRDLIYGIAFSLIALGFTARSINGTASIYHDKFHGRRTATGEVFSQHKLTAASNFVKLGSRVRVTNLVNLKSVIVKINDRMHPSMAKKGRVVDLSEAAAREIGNRGLVRVRVEML